MSQEKVRVLIADDVPQVRQELVTMLELAAKYRLQQLAVVGEACNGAEAIEQTRKLHPDVVLMDLEMPIMDGFEATRRIKAELPGTRTIILTIHAGSEEQEQARMAGADGFLTKGCSIETLLNAILPNH